MPSLELDKPSTAPIQPDSEEDDVQLRPSESGRPGALLQDAQGGVVYPNHVPPNIESPVDTPTSPRQHTQEPGLDEQITSRPGRSEPSADAALLPQESRSEPARQTSSQQTKRQRPAFGQKFLTDAPRHNQRRSSTFPIPSFKRTGTNVSILQQALWENQAHQGDDFLSGPSSSEDESDEADKDQPPRPSARPVTYEGRTPSEDRYRRFKVANTNFHTKGKVSKRDGRLNITVNDTSNTGYLAKALGAAVKNVVVGKGDEGRTIQRPNPSRWSSETTTTSKTIRRPRLNIVIMVIGSRGDAQPFLKIGKVLKEEYGHRVRIATHPAFRDFVEKDSGLEFFSVGGDPSELMAFMVKNPGMIPKLETVRAGDIGKRRNAMAEMFEGFWRACINATDDEKDAKNLKMMADQHPFVADAIIANPPSFAHVHCAEALGIPLHLMFTFPYSPTQAFPHPLATIKKSNVDPGYTNFISYPLVEMMVWQGLGDLVNQFRTRTLGLDPVSTLWAPGSTYRLRVPFTYLWSPALVPKPQDWGPEIDVAGFVFLDLASSFQPPQDLVEFLDAGEPPIYIGFGSIVVDDADRFTQLIFEAVRQAGVRALVSKGWGGLGQDNVPENVFMLENTPHDWLFPKVRACVIHGGAGTTAIALRCGKPTMIVPFFGDQHFWGPMVSKAGAGPEPVPYKQLSVENLAEGIKYCLTDEALKAAQEIAQSIDAEGDGAKNAVAAFHSNLIYSGEHSMRCSILPERVAVWKVKGTSLKLSALAADLAVAQDCVSWRQLRLLRHREWNDFEGPGEPVTGIAGTVAGTVGDVLGGIGSVPYRVAKRSTKRAEFKKKKAERKSQRQKIASQNLGGFPFPQEGQIARGDGTETEGRPGNVSAPLTSTPGTAPLGPAQEEYFNDVQEGVGKSGRALARAPVDLSLAVAQGFHNAPRLYGDDTVRPPVRVTGFKSGLRAARHEFVFGLYDGTTGVIRLPIRGAKQDGFMGAISGFGMGLIGLILKPLAAFLGPIGYTLKGIAKEVSGNKKQSKYLRRARVIDAQRQLYSLSDEERKAVTEEVAKGWTVMTSLADIIKEENGKRSVKGHLQRSIGKKGQKSKSLGKWGTGRGFESVAIAERAIEAIRQGENVEVVLGKNRKSTEQERREIDERISHEMEESRKSTQASRLSQETRQLSDVAEDRLKDKTSDATTNQTGQTGDGKPKADSANGNLLPAPKIINGHLSAPLAG
ncbi:hypothetical protein F5Y15DRAFT_147119 [Xylariaceae sp. FL0016]|nr:hypothetical protein F5Y15DRAFT_147119 [Xylariaceae sp. FL0016]